MRMKSFLATAACAALVTSASAQIDWSNPTVETFKTGAQIDADAGSFVLDDTLGVVNDSAGNVYVLIDDSAFEDIFLKYDNAGNFIAASAGLDDFQSGKDGDFRFTGTIRETPGGDILFADFQGATGTNFHTMDPTTLEFTDESDDADNAGVGPFGILTGTQIIAPLTFGDGTIRIIDYATGATGADIGGGAIANVRGLDVYDDGSQLVAVAIADNGQTVVRIEDPAGTPVVTDISANFAPYQGATPESGTVRNLLLGPNGEVIITDRGDFDGLRIFDGTTVYEHPYTTLAAASADFGSFDLRDNRGISMYTPDPDTVVIFAANTPNGEEGVVKITFTSAPASVDNWTMYD